VASRSGIRSILVLFITALIVGELPLRPTDCQQTLANARLIIYPDSGHGSVFQHARAYTSHGTEFLERKWRAVVRTAMHMKGTS